MSRNFEVIGELGRFKIVRYDTGMHFAIPEEDIVDGVVQREINGLEGMCDMDCEVVLQRCETAIQLDALILENPEMTALELTLLMITQNGTDISEK